MGTSYVGGHGETVNADFTHVADLIKWPGPGRVELIRETQPKKVVMTLVIPHDRHLIRRILRNNRRRSGPTPFFYQVLMLLEE